MTPLGLTVDIIEFGSIIYVLDSSGSRVTGNSAIISANRRSPPEQWNPTVEEKNVGTFSIISMLGWKWNKLRKVLSVASGKRLMSTTSRLLQRRNEILRKGGRKERERWQ